MSLTESQASAVETAEKVSSVLSVVGAAFIISTFLLDTNFRKPINRLVFYAAWGNLFANVATLISRSGIRLGVTSSLCQFQGFLIQWFMPADALWTFAMACNVYLSFFHSYDAAQLRQLEWKYLGACYGVPLIPALVYLFVRSHHRGRMYGSAVLWCWVTEEWNALRIATFYGPVWVVILIIMFVYIRVGFLVFKWRKQLLSMDSKVESLPTEIHLPERSSTVVAKTYEVSITSQVPHSPDHARHLSSSSRGYPDRPRSPPQERFSSINETAFQTGRPVNIIVPEPEPEPVVTVDANKATISYCKTAMLFFVALFCTWVPSTVNRVYTFVNPDTVPFGLDLASGLVLPLQGFWNTMVYIATSLPACRALWQDLRTCSPFASPSRGLPPLLRRRGRDVGSTDTRADIVVSSKKKENRVVHHYHHYHYPDHDHHQHGHSSPDEFIADEVTEERHQPVHSR